MTGEVLVATRADRADISKSQHCIAVQSDVVRNVLHHEEVCPDLDHVTAERVERIDPRHIDELGLTLCFSQ